MWTYRCYDDSGTPDLWKRWYDEQQDVQGSHDAVFEILEQREQWGEPHTKFFDKKNRIIEVRLNGDVKWRVFGYYGPQRREFIVLGTGYHKQGRYYPHEIAALVARRKKEIERDQTKAVRCERPGKTS